MYVHARTSLPVVASLVISPICACYMVSPVSELFQFSWCYTYAVRVADVFARNVPARTGRWCHGCLFMVFFQLYGCGAERLSNIVQCKTVKPRAECRRRSCHWSMVEPSHFLSTLAVRLSSCHMPGDPEYGVWSMVVSSNL